MPLPAGKFRRHGMGPQKRGLDVLGSGLLQPAGRSQHPEFRFQVQAVSGLDLHRGDSLVQKMVQALQCEMEQDVFIRCPGGLDRGKIPPPALAMSA